MPVSSDKLVVFLAKTAQGDRKAFADLYQSTSSVLYGMCLNLLRNREEAQDVLQEAYIQVWHHAGEYHVDRGTPMTWIMSIGRYRCLDALRRRRHDSTYDEVEHDYADDSMGPMTEAASMKDSQRLSACLQELNTEYRSSIEMAYFRGFSHQELATATGQPLGTTKSRVRRGLDLLRRCLGS
ncbi:MAG: sigma-70 family RNA polymerase sigma factor [Alcanivoracaceae bacterium]|nr:sigma-70 family RNA polymerase sigma factor [Alcanivoracaceae bacterium]